MNRYNANQNEASLILFLSLSPNLRPLKIDLSECVPKLLLRFINVIAQDVDRSYLYLEGADDKQDEQDMEEVVEEEAASAEQ